MRVDAGPVLWRARFGLALATLAAGIAAFALSSQQPPVYEAANLLQVVSGRQASGEFVNRDELLHLTNVMARVARTTGVAERAARDGQGTVDDYKNVEVTSESEVEVLRVTATDRSPAKAAQVANDYAAAVIAVIEDQQDAARAEDVRRLEQRIAVVTPPTTSPTGRANGVPDPVPNAQLQAFQVLLAERLARSSDGVRELEPATPPSEPIAPSPLRDAVLAAISVLGLGLVFVYTRAALSDRFTGVDEISRLLDLAVLGEIPRSRSADAQDEAFRTLRTSVDFGLRSHDRPVVLVSSADPGAGKTHIVANLARAFAADGRRVVAVDSDVRRPNLHARLRVPLAPGLGDLLASDQRGAAELQLSEVALSTTSRRGGDLDVVAAGSSVPDPAEALSSARMERAVGTLRSTYDVVLLDSPPLVGVADALVLARYSDAVLLVIDRRRDRRSATRRAVEMLRSVNAPLLGFVYNGGVRAGRVYGTYGNRGSVQPRPVPERSSATGS